MRISADEIKSLSTEVFAAAGCCPEESRRVSQRLVESNLVGHDSHGVIRIPSYVEWLRDEKVYANRSLRVVSDNGPIVVVDGQFGLGQTIGEQAMDIAIEKATTHGVSVVALRNSGHLGRIGDWAEMAAAAGKLSIHFVSSSGAGMLVAPHGGIDRRLTANPIAAGIPTEDGLPIVLDMSASTIAEGKIRVALNQGAALAEGCIIDANGQPTTDPRRFYADPPGAMLPIAGHKGYALTFIIEILAGALTANLCSHPDHKWRVVNGMLTVVLDQKWFGSVRDFNAEVTRFIEFVKSSRPSAPDGEVLIPGELERRTRARRLEAGLELDDTTWRQIYETCQSLNITPQQPAPAPARQSKLDENLSIPGCQSAAAR